MIVGVGRVGSTFAFALLASGLADEIVLVDADLRRAEGEAMDLDHARPFLRPSVVRAGTVADCAEADVVVLAAGHAQATGQTRLDLARQNTDLVRRILDELAPHLGRAVLVVATNPVDVVTYVARAGSGLPPGRVVGTGTLLDTARLRARLAHHVGVDPTSVHAYVLGEHGDSEVVPWSLAEVGGMPLRSYCASRGVSFDSGVANAIATETRRAAYEIIARKGATNQAIAAGLVRLVDAVLHDRKRVLTVSVPPSGTYDLPEVSLSLPAVIGRTGVEHVLPVELLPGEEAALRRSADVIRQALTSLGLP